MKLSILIPTIVGRENLLDELLLSLRRQYTMKQHRKIKSPDGGMVSFIYFLDGLEIIYCRDNKEMPVGEKRNKLIEVAKGDR